jgi:tRNA A-37 threonylcarbamoyl transferase component Bud32
VNRRTPELPEGVRVGPYTLKHCLGKGATAHVYLAVTDEGKEFALKIRVRGRPDTDRRFLREFEALRRLHLPGVIRVYEAGQTEKWLWFTMDVVGGPSLFEYIQSAQRLEERVTRACRLGVQLGRSLEGIHAAGLVHRDLKPSNILVTESEEIRVLDFGVVGWWSAGEPLTSTGTTVGTLPYMSPEQMAGHTPTSAIDVFSAAVTLYEAVAGKRDRPEHPHGWIARQILERFVPLASLFPEIPKPFSAILSQALSLDPRDRPLGGEFADAMAEVLEGTGSPVWPEPAVFVGRNVEFEVLKKSLEGEDERMVFIRGKAGDGRRRLLEQSRRHAILQGHQTYRARCHQDQPGGAIGTLLDQLLRVHSSAALRKVINTSDAQVLLAMWPGLPLQALAGDTALFDVTRKQVVSAVARIFLHFAEEEPILLGFTDIEDISSITSQVIRTLLAARPETLTLIGIVDDRWMNANAIRLVETQVKKGFAREIRLVPLDKTACRKLYKSIVPNAVPPEDYGPATPLQVCVDALKELARFRGETYPILCEEDAILAAMEDPIPGSVLQTLTGNAMQAVDRGIVYRGSNPRFSIAGDHILRVCQSFQADRTQMSAALAQAWEAWTDGGKLRWVDIAASRIRGESSQMDCWEAAVRAATSLERVGRNADARKWLMLLDSLKRDPNSDLFKELRFALAYCRTKVAHSCDTERIRRDLLEQATKRVRVAKQHQKVALLEVQIRRREGKLRSALAGALSASASARAEFPVIALRLLLEALRCRFQLNQTDEAARGLEMCDTLLARIRSPLLEVEVSLARSELLLALGRPARVIALAQESRRKAETLHFPYAKALAMLYESGAHQQLGDRRLAQHLAREAHNLFLILGHPERRAETAILMAELALGSGESRGASLLANEALVASKKLVLPLVYVRSQDLIIALAGATGNTKTGEKQLKKRRTSSDLPTHQALAETTWWRWQNDPKSAGMAASRCGVRGYPAALAQLELARTLMQNDRVEDSGAALQKGRNIAVKEGFMELVMYARLIEGALLPQAEFPDWEALIERCISEYWMELFLGALEFDGRRKMRQGQNSMARTQLEALRLRSEDLGFQPYTDNATALIQKIGLKTTG